jgi:hypothetical protein
MRSASIYDSRGAITESMEGSEEDIHLFTTGKQFIEGFFPANKYYVDQSQAIEFPPQPANTIWDWTTKQWVLSFDFADAEAKQKRNSLLQQSDWTQIPNNPLTAEQQQAWAVYRQELRDITSQSGHPFNVIWPTPPQG